MTIDEAIAKFDAELPGWWWSIGFCSVSADASCGPDVAGPDAALLDIGRTFDHGFHADLRQPATCVEVLMNVLEQAKAAKAGVGAGGGKGQTASEGTLKVTTGSSDDGSVDLIHRRREKLEAAMVAFTAAVRNSGQ